MFCEMQNVLSNFYNLILDPSKNILNTFYFYLKIKKSKNIFKTQEDKSSSFNKPK